MSDLERLLGERAGELQPAAAPPFERIVGRRRNRMRRRVGSVAVLAVAGAAVVVGFQPEGVESSRDVVAAPPAPAGATGPARAATQFPSDEPFRECRDASQSADGAATREVLGHRDVPVAVTVCEAVWKRLDGQGTWRVRRTVSLTGADAAPLLAALREPSAPQSDGPCPLIGYSYPAFSVTLDDGTVAHPGIPTTDGCGKPSPGAVELLGAALRRPDVREVPIAQMRSENATETNCNETGKIYPPDLRPAVPNRPRAGAIVAVCAYDAKPGQKWELPLSATGWTTGRFVLDLIERIDLDARPAGCTEAGFEGSVKLQASDLDDFSMLVETAGCHRVVDLEGNLMGTLTARDAALVRRLADRPEK